MNNLIIKEVNFNGDNLLAVKNNDNKIYVGVSYICNGIGLSEGQMKNERKKIQEDLVLSKGGRNLILPTNGGNQEVLGIELDFLPLWLAKISITPKMIKDNPAVVNKLVDYQLKAKDVLANAFIHGQYNLPTTYKEALIQLLTVVEEKEKIEEQNKVLIPKAEGYDDFLSAKNAQTMNECAKVLKIGRNKLFKFLRQNDVLMSNNLPYQRFCDSKYFTVREVHFIRGNYEYNGCQCLVAAKGLDFIQKLLKEKGFCGNSLALNKNNVAI